MTYKKINDPYVRAGKGFLKNRKTAGQASGMLGAFHWKLKFS